MWVAFSCCSAPSVCVCVCGVCVCAVCVCVCVYALFLEFAFIFKIFCFMCFAEHPGESNALLYLMLNYIFYLLLYPLRGRGLVCISQLNL